jgi:hypothetical protein
VSFGPKRLRVCVTGGRDFTDKAFVWRCLNEFEQTYGEIIELGEGEATGVDTLAREWAEAAGVRVRKYAADWERWGDAAGSIRNGEMLADFRPSYLLCFPGGTGTANCIRQARKMKIERVIYNLTNDPFEDALRWG